MSPPIPVLVFTDLDGTLIGHDSYSWTPAGPALAALRRIGAGIVLASSKTAPEILALRDELDLTAWPAIVENGAGVLEAGLNEAKSPDQYLALRAILNEIPSRLRANYRGFGDMSAGEIAQITGLSDEAATLAMRRAFSEPGLWSGSQADLAEFLAVLARRNVSAREGGRFLTLSFGQTKADRMAEIIAQYHPRHTIALGDAPNDVEMLQAADYGVIVANSHRDPLPSLPGENTGRIFRTQQPGPEGWNDAIFDLIASLGLG